MDYLHNDTIELVAEEIHKIWIHWAENLLNTEPNLSTERKNRWQEECFKPYSALTIEMKELDRKFATRILTTIKKINK
ncbi:MAG: hypothetical protein P1U56_19445 [Saprospiraceae bacterium]|nr:hypothetical protein [Saprospiraceae bacterium]